MRNQVVSELVMAFDTYMWEVGKKEIFVGIALEETDRGDIYYVLGQIDRKGS